jgi:hypothetical protein
LRSAGELRSPWQILSSIKVHKLGEEISGNRGCT